MRLPRIRRASRRTPSGGAGNSLLDQAVAAADPSPVPRPAVDHPLLDLEGTERLFSERVKDTGPVLLVLLSTTCGSCRAIVASLDDVQAQLGEGLRVQPVVLGSLADAAEHFAGAPDVWVAPGADSWRWARTFELRATPAFAVVDREGTVLADAAGDYATADAVLALLR